jgi:pentatricopeptide repeat protein
MVKSFRGVAIRTHVLAGRLDEAIEMLKVTRAQNLHIPRFTGELLLHKVEQNMGTEKVTLVRELLSYRGYKLDVGSASNPAATTIPHAKSSQSANLTSKLRILKRSLVSHYPPTAQALTNFMAEYKAAGRHRALFMLRKMAFRHNYRSISLWMMAEMLYHYRREEHDMVIVAFSTYFHLIGVPEEAILRRLEILAKRRERRAERPDLPWHIISPQYPMAEKVWPSPYHTALVWQALVIVSKEPLELEQLYIQLIYFAKLCSGHHTSSTTTPSPLPIPPPKQSIDQAHFTPFIKAFTERMGPNRAIQAVSDMLGLGIRLSVYHCTVLLGAFAREGDVTKVMDILDRMEGGVMETDVVEAKNSAMLPAPTIATYTSVLHGFVNAACLDAALEVKERLIGKAGYVSGSNPKTERALVLLRALQREAATRSTGIFVSFACGLACGVLTIAL